MGDRSEGSDTAAPPGRVSLAAAAIVAVVAFLATLRRTAGIGLLGFDTYPLILTSRIGSLGDVAAAFTERLMHGRYPGAFYRPLLSLSVGLDAALHGLRPLGYHVTGAAIFAATGWALFLLARQLGGPGARLAPWATLVSFLVHPFWIEVVPVPARRSELLCVLFLALALAAAAAPRPAAWPRLARALLIGLGGLAAIAAKETGFVAPALGFAAGFLVASERPTGSRRIRTALGSAAPLAAAAAISMAARILVLGGLGGQPGANPLLVLPRLGRALGRVLDHLVAPQPLIAGAGRAGALLALVCLAGAALASRNRVLRSGGGPRPGTVAMVGLLWILLVGATYAAADTLEPWYLVIPAGGFALIAGAGAEVAARGWRSPAPLARGLGGLGGLALAALLAAHLAVSPWFGAYREWQRGTAASDEFLAALASRIESATDGATILAPPLPQWVPSDPGRPTVFGAAVLTDYSVQAWAELRFPERRVRVTIVTSPPLPTPAPGETLVVISRLRVGFVGP